MGGSLVVKLFIFNGRSLSLTLFLYGGGKEAIK